MVKNSLQMLTNVQIQMHAERTHNVITLLETIVVVAIKVLKEIRTKRYAFYERVDGCLNFIQLKQS